MQYIAASRDGDEEGEKEREREILLPEMGVINHLRMDFHIYIYTII